MEDRVCRYENVEIAGSGLTEDVARRLVSKRVDMDKMEKMDADRYARKIMYGIGGDVWEAMEHVHKMVRGWGFSRSEALIQLACDILESAEEEVYENDAMNSLGIVGKTVYVYEDGTFDKPRKISFKKPVAKKSVKKTAAKNAR